MADESTVTRFADLIGANHVLTAEAARAYTVDGCVPQCVLLPATTDELSRCAALTAQADLAVIPVGNGTHLGVGRVPHRYDVALSTRRLRRMVAHAAADMTVTVEAGLTLAEVNAMLAAAGQRLPLDPPRPEQTTVGALIAADASGPLRWSQGKVRDLLIGITVVLADGTMVKGGGRVVKNVAGYDLMKLFTGSFGTLATIVEATFKLRPVPECEAAFVLPASGTAAAVGAALEVLAAPVAPLYVEALNGAAARLADLDVPGAAVAIGCGGAPEEIAVQQQRIQAQLGAQHVRVCNAEETVRVAAALRDFPARRHHGCRISLLPSRLAGALSRLEDEVTECGADVALLSHVGSGIASIRLGEIADDGMFAACAERLRSIVHNAGGWVVFDALPASLKERVDPWDTDVPGLSLMRAIKTTLDPKNHLSPGRFVGGI